jgi:hypothetical protein
MIRSQLWRQILNYYAVIIGRWLETLYNLKSTFIGKERGNLRLRGAALIAVLAGAVGSVGFLLRAGQRTPRLLLVFMALWVLSPFVVLACANVASKRWSIITRTALHSVMLILTLGSLAIYGHDALRPRKAQAAFVFVAVPPASWLLAIVVPIAALISRRRSRRADGA